MAEVRLQARAPGGALLNPNVMVSFIEWTMEENTFWVLRAGGPLADVDPGLFQQDTRFEVLRFVDGLPGYVEGDTQYLLRWWEFGEDDDGLENWKIEAFSLDYLLTGRFVDSFASQDGDVNPLTTKSGAADDVMKEVTAENLGASAALATRRVGELSIEADLGTGENIDKSFAWRRLLDVYQEIAAASLEDGTYLSFGITANGGGTGCTLRTWTGQRGTDHTRGTRDEVIVSKAMFNLRVPRVAFDHRNEFTAVRIGGAGQGRSRLTVRVEDTARSGASPFAYREVFIENTQAKTTATLTADARAKLRGSRAVRSFAGKLVDVPYSRYGVRVKFGDLVTAEYLGQSFTCRISRVAGRWSRDLAEELEIDLVGSEVA